MKPGRAPDRQIIQAQGELPADAFVNPIELQYVPKDTRERLGITDFSFNPITQVVCYTRLGMMIVPRANIKVV